MPGQPGKPLIKPGEFRVLYGPVAVIFDGVQTGSWRIFRPEVDETQCAGCALCQTFCPADVIDIHTQDKDLKVIEIDWTFCKGCGICANVCPKKCIKMVKERQDGQ